MAATEIKSVDSASLDAFSRWRISNPAIVFDSQHQYNASPVFWESILVGGGTATHQANRSSVSMAVATSGDKVTRQTYVYHRYQPGKSLLVLMSTVIGDPETNLRRRLGYFDDNNGIFFEQSAGENHIVLRTNVSGSPSDSNKVAQSAWNIDPMDGSGASKVDLDFTKSQILVLDFEWLGVGRVRCGWRVGGVTYYFHEFLNTNNVSSVYMTTANLPLRLEIEATGAIGSTYSLEQICASVIAEGGFDSERSLVHSVNNGSTGVSISTRASVISIRPKTTFNSITNRGQVIPENFELLITGTGVLVLWELVWGGAVTGASWTSAGTNSIVEYSVTSAAVTGGEIILSGYGTSENKVAENISAAIASVRPLSLDYAGTSSRQLSLVCTAVTGNPTIYSSLAFKELY